MPMEDPAIQAFTQQLRLNPHDWFVRAHLVGLFEGRGDLHKAAEIIMGAPEMPVAREHILAAVRILTPVNPAASLHYLELLGQAGATALSSATAEPHPAGALPLDAAAIHEAWRSADVEALTGEVHLTALPPKKFAAKRFAVTVALHAVALAAAGFWVVSRQTIKGKESLEFDPTPPRTSATKGTETAVKMARKRSSSSAPSAAKRVLAKNSVSSIALPEIKNMSALADVTNLMASGMGGAGTGRGFGGAGGSGPGGTGMGGLRGHFVGPMSIDSRCSKGDREKRIAQAGGVPETELNVAKSLAWLKNQQNRDGSWGRRNKASMTGLTLLAYLGHCETPDSSKDYGETVMKGITWLLDLWLKKEFLSENDPKSNAAPYEHGIATYALAEAYSMTRYGTKRIPNLREAVLGAIDVIVKGQDSEGGWNYGYGPPEGGGSDMSVSGWQVQAMNAARHTGMEFAGMDEAFKKAMKYVQNSQAESGAFGYRGSNGARYGMTGIAGLCLIVGGLDRGAEMRKATEFLKSDWDKRRSPFVYDTEDCQLYCSYYINQVAFMRGGLMWRKWNKSLQDELLPNQNPDGSYKQEGGFDSSHGSRAAGAGNADLYRTALCTLMLEVYYRYLPATEKLRGAPGDE